MVPPAVPALRESMRAQRSAVRTHATQPLLGSLSARDLLLGSVVTSAFVCSALYAHTQLGAALGANEADHSRVSLFNASANLSSAAAVRGSRALVGAFVADAATAGAIRACNTQYITLTLIDYP